MLFVNTDRWQKEEDGLTHSRRLPKFCPLCTAIYLPRIPVHVRCQTSNNINHHGRRRLRYKHEYEYSYRIGNKSCWHDSKRLKNADFSFGSYGHPVTMLWQNKKTTYSTYQYRIFHVFWNEMKRAVNFE